MDGGMERKEKNQWSVIFPSTKFLGSENFQELIANIYVFYTDYTVFTTISHWVENKERQKRVLPMERLDFRFEQTGEMSEHCQNNI